MFYFIMFHSRKATLKNVSDKNLLQRLFYSAVIPTYI